jgi:hypothetical protein
MNPASIDQRVLRGRPVAPLAHSPQSAPRIRRAVAAIAAACVLSAASAQAAIRVEAYRGEPLGVGRVTVDLPPGASASPWSDDRFTLTEASNRVLYPVIENTPVRRILRNFLRIETPWRATFYFMFRGDEPLELVLYAPDAQRFTVRPERDRNGLNELLDDWWNATEGRYQQVYRLAEYPVVVENYLTATWARRLGREMPEPRMYLLRMYEWGDSWISKLMANEAYQNNIERDLLLGAFSRNEAATIPLPSNSRDGEPPSASLDTAEELPAPAAALPASVEPIAGHVPQECFYLRFGNFPNYLWFRDFLRHWQGDLANMIVLQGVNHDNNERFQQQIAVGETEIARVMGPRVIRDVALIGFDPYLRDGTAMGILFQANISALLSNNLNDQRHKAMKEHAGATEKTVQLAGHDVSYMSSPDGRLRSYYALDGDFHLVTTSRRLVERFFQAGMGQKSLGAAADFQASRAAMPLDRDDTMFLFASGAFFEHITGPHYRVELDRRLRSIGEMRALRLARLAGKAEGLDDLSVTSLVDAELLPPGFGRRADGSKIVESNGELRDSLRGVRGAMLPIADIPVDHMTPTEAARYTEFRRGMESQVGRFAPLSLALKRTPSSENNAWDRITVELRLDRYSQSRLASLARMLGPAAAVRVAPIAGDVASIEVVVDALGQPVHLFGGLRDFRTPLVVRQGEVQADARAAEYIRAYVGGFPRPHLLDRFLGGPTGQFDDQGIARNNRLFDLWLRRADDFFLFSFKRDVLIEVGQQLAMVEAERPAQIRLQIDDLSDKELATAMSGIGYMRARATSASGPRFMNSLTTQLHVPPGEARAVAEDLVGGMFKCPLGGEYVLTDPNAPARLPETTEEQLPPPDGAVAPATVDSERANNSRKLWASTAVPVENRFLLTEVPTDYQMPMLNWFRGINADLARGGDELRMYAELDMVHLEVAPVPTDSGEGFKLPSLGNLFGGWGKDKDDEVKPASVDEDLPPPARQ